ncbi:hypothetical protein [Pseudalkalibacillus caeni]|nr:hypothetical protein [Pseudalkalibacillus caeni]
MRSKVIIVEGIPGSGKTTTAKHIEKILKEKDIPVKLFLEGSLDQPADYEYTGCLNEEQFEELVGKHPEDRELIARFTVKKGDNFFISYMKLYDENKEKQSLIDDIAAYDVYELPLEKHLPVALEKWKEFSEKAANEEAVYIFECCFIQNPLTVMLGKHGAPSGQIRKHVLEIAETIKGLNPIVIYLHQDNIRETIERVIPERPEAWYNGIIQYFTEQGYGKAQGLEGFDGFVKVLEKRRELELELIEELPFQSLVIDNSDRDWEKIYREIDEMITGKVTAV